MLIGILESLKFPSMNDRYLGIDQAYKCVVGARKTTFDWIFDRPGPGFVDWLEKGNGIFWINGKAGSGKSTLMKFIRDDQRLRSSLKGVTETPRDVIIADFYFWAAGSAAQRSQIGLLMTIIYCVLKQAKNLLPNVASEQWEHVRPIAARVVERIEKRNKKSRAFMGENTKKILLQVVQESRLQWTREALLQLFHNLLMEMPSSTQLFILLDGLDEYEAREEEMEDLAELLKRTSQRSNVKICLSTRPWTIFENHFGRGQLPTFQLQNLTYNDIKTFVKDSFDRSELMQINLQAYPKQIPDFYSSIIEKAEGVFLWVRLVVRSLIRGLQDGDELSDLQKKVDELPKDLERLYMHMLDRIEPKYWERSSKIFGIVGAASESLNALTIWFSGEPEANPLEDLAVETKLARCYQVHLRLMSQCAGLLELRAHGFDRNKSEDVAEADLLQPDESWSFSKRRHYLESSVHYLHRTTKDFLNSNNIATTLRDRIGGEADFDPHRWLAVHALVELSSITVKTQRYDSNEELWDTGGFIVSGINHKFCFHAMRCKHRESASRLLKIRDSILASIGLEDRGNLVQIIENKRSSPQIEDETADKLLGTKKVSDSPSPTPEELDFRGRDELESLLREEGVEV